MCGDRILYVCDKLTVAEHIEDILYHITHQLSCIVQIFLDGRDWTHIDLQIFGNITEHIGLLIQRNAFFAKPYHLILYIGNRAENLFAGSSDRCDRVSYVHNIRNISFIIGEYLAQILSHSFQFFYGMVETLAAHFGSILNLGYEAVHITGKLFRLVCQASDLIGNNGKAFACFTGSGSFDRSVQGKHIGLRRNRIDPFDHFVHAFDDLEQFLHVILHLVRFVNGIL